MLCLFDHFKDSFLQQQHMFVILYRACILFAFFFISIFYTSRKSKKQNKLNVHLGLLKSTKKCCKRKGKMCSVNIALTSIFIITKEISSCNKFWKILCMMIPYLYYISSSVLQYHELIRDNCKLHFIYPIHFSEQITLLVHRFGYSDGSKFSLSYYMCSIFSCSNNVFYTMGDYQNGLIFQQEYHKALFQVFCYSQFI